MTASLKKTSTTKQRMTKRPVKTTTKKSTQRTITKMTAKRRIKEFLLRRPHRSFRRTKRRDYVRSLKLPGYWSFTNTVRKMLWIHKKLFLGIVAFYGIFTAILVGIGSQDTYAQLADVLQQSGGDIFAGNLGEVGKAGLLLISTATGSITPQLTDVQQVYTAFLLLFTWLTTVWLLRAILSGNKPRLRDGVYNAGSPIIPTLLVGLLLLVQLVPGALAVLGYSAAFSTGFFSYGLISMLLAFVGILLIVLSLYLMTSTFLALIVVTLPGMYPWQAIRTAGDLVVGRRIRILFRLLWLIGLTLSSWLIVIIPIIILDSLLKSALPAISWLPVVPLALALVSSLSLVWVASYVYMLYRKIVEDDASPA